MQALNSWSGVGGGGMRGNLSALTAGQEKTLLNSYNVRFNATTNG